jgi:hypothetical protein
VNAERCLKGGYRPRSDQAFRFFRTANPPLKIIWQLQTPYSW